MTWAEVPAPAWDKWDWAFKTVMFSAFIPLVIRSRVQIEAFAQTYVFSLAANFIPFGLKTLVSGGGYGHNLGLDSGNSNLAEGGLLSTICLMAIPLALHLARHTQLLPRSRLVALGYAGLAGLALVTAIGTFERSALIGLVVMGVYMFTRSRHKLVFLLVASVVVLALVYKMSAGYQDRIASIADPTKETSALTRLLVWKWTFNYALSHPFGGGFMAYQVDRIDYPGGEVVFGRAFHSIYFEVLGEQGWVGLGLFLGVAMWTFFGLRRLTKRIRKIPHLAWAADMSDALQIGLAVFMTAGAFVGIAFQPAFWYFIAMSVSLREYVHRVQSPEKAVTRWRAGRLVGGGLSAGHGGAAALNLEPAVALRSGPRSSVFGRLATRQRSRGVARAVCSGGGLAQNEVGRQHRKVARVATAKPRREGQGLQIPQALLVRRPICQYRYPPGAVEHRCVVAVPQPVLERGHARQPP